MDEVESLSHTKWECKYGMEFITNCRRKTLYASLRKYIKGKSAIHLARMYEENLRNFVGQHFRPRGYFVSTIGRTQGAANTPTRRLPVAA